MDEADVSNSVAVIVRRKNPVSVGIEITRLYKAGLTSTLYTVKGRVSFRVNSFRAETTDSVRNEIQNVYLTVKIRCV
jgi:hypothetical protein